jgi:uncharacterized cysteine cluster protein YcgN (CxxCxxCC family)
VPTCANSWIMTEFWQGKALVDLTPGEWESLCDGCGRCCLHKLEDEDTGELYFTNVACRLLDLNSCRCREYARRAELIPDCLVLTPSRPELFAQLPSTCAYRLLSEGRPLPEWHPLVSGNMDSVHRAGISVRGKVVSEEYIHPEQLSEHLISWIVPGRPKAPAKP